MKFTVFRGEEANEFRDTLDYYEIPVSEVYISFGQWAFSFPTALRDVVDHIYTEHGFTNRVMPYSGSAFKFYQ